MQKSSVSRLPPPVFPWNVFLSQGKIAEENAIIGLIPRTAQKDQSRLAHAISHTRLLFDFFQCPKKEHIIGTVEAAMTKC